MLQPVPEKTRLDIVTGTEIKIPNGQNSCLFSNEPFEKRPVMTIEDFDFHSADHFESLWEQAVHTQLEMVSGMEIEMVSGMEIEILPKNLFGNRLYTHNNQNTITNTQS